MKKIFLVCIVFASFTACELEELDDMQGQAQTQENSNDQVVVDNLFTPKSKIEAESILTGANQKEWITTSFTLGGSSTVGSCRLDDEMTFNSNKTYFYLRGASCLGEDTQAQRTGSWELNFDTRKIIFDSGTSSEYTAAITGLTDSEIRLQGSYFNLEIKGVFTIK